MKALLPERLRMSDGPTVIATGLWELRGTYRGACILSEHARGILPNAIVAARKMLADDVVESAACQESPQIARVELWQHLVGGMGGWAHTFCGHVTRRGFVSRKASGR